jgi:hypothetical protein
LRLRVFSLPSESRTEECLIPNKIRQLQDYWNLFQSEEFTYYWSTILDLSSAEKKKGKWDGEMAFWFNIKDMSSDFSKF